MQGHEFRISWSVSIIHKPIRKKKVSEKVLYMVCDCAYLASETALLPATGPHPRMARVRHLRASAPGATATRIRAREPWVLRARRGIGRKAPEVSVSAAVRVLVLKTPRPLFMGPTQPAEACLYICAVKDREQAEMRRTMCRRDSDGNRTAARSPRQLWLRPAGRNR
jgi:hypothetical protein